MESIRNDNGVDSQVLIIGTHADKEQFRTIGMLYEEVVQEIPPSEREQFAAAFLKRPGKRGHSDTETDEFPLIVFYAREITHVENLEIEPDILVRSFHGKLRDIIKTLVGFVIEGKNAPDNGQSTYVYKNKKEKENKNININSSHERDRIESNLISEESSNTMRSDSDATANTISKSVFQNYEKRIKANIGYDDLLIAHPLDIELIENLLDLIVEQMLSSSDETLIAGSKYPTEYVKRKLLKLDYTHMEYALECFKKNTTKVRNIKKYLLSILFNAPSTIEGYYNAEVHHDMPWLAK